MEEKAVVEEKKVEFGSVLGESPLSGRRSEQDRGDAGQLRPCEYQVAGHLFEEGKAGSLVDDCGHFYKPIQPGPRGDRETTFYLDIHGAKKQDLELYLKGHWCRSMVEAVESMIGGESMKEALYDVITQKGASPFSDGNDGMWNRVISDTSEASKAGRLPTFCRRPSVMHGAKNMKDIEVREKDAVGLVIGTVLQEQDVDWSEEEEEMNQMHEGSPDSDSGYGMTTGERVMSTIRSALAEAVALDGRPESGPVERHESVSTSSSTAEEYEKDRLQNASPTAHIGAILYTDSSDTIDEGKIELVQQQQRAHGKKQYGGIRFKNRSGDSLDIMLQIQSMSFDPSLSLQREGEKQAKSENGRRKSMEMLQTDLKDSIHVEVGSLSHLPFSVRNAPLLRVIPKFYGVLHRDDRILLELEDLARGYSHPSIIDIKIGRRTWYAGADAAYIERCQMKDGSTTQSSLGFKICGMQVYRHRKRGYWRASKRWCKTLPEPLVDQALESFAHNENGLKPIDVYGGPDGVVKQLELLEEWFELQTEFKFFSSSILILYEGDATGSSGTNVSVRLVDFAHTFCNSQGHEEKSLLDENFLGGLSALRSRLLKVSEKSLC
eukprot:jgi/Picsp_1/1380/NSC_04859-R1_inositol polyphosphate multikinase alpha